MGALTSPPSLPFFLPSFRSLPGVLQPLAPEPGGGPGFSSLLRPLPDHSLSAFPTASLKPQCWVLGPQKDTAIAPPGERQLSTPLNLGP